MRNDLTEIVIILDRSGSMHKLQDETIQSFNKFLNEQKAVEGEANFTLALFSDRYTLASDRENIKEAKELTKETYSPDGWTALYDAVGRTIKDIGKKLAATPESERPGKVLVVILTDGYENASREYTSAAIKQMIEEQRNTWKWDFMFLGANQDAFLSAATISIPTAWTANIAATGAGIGNASYHLTNATTSYRKGNSNETVASLGNLNADTRDDRVTQTTTA